MARWPRGGSGIASLYERTPIIEEMIKAGLVEGTEFETTLPKVIADLHLAPLSPDDDQQIRLELGEIIHAGLDRFAHSPKYSATERVTVARVKKILRGIANALDKGSLDRKKESEVARFLHGAETGLRTTMESAVATHLKKFLPENVSLRNFRAHRLQIAAACRYAAAHLEGRKQKPGSAPLNWSGFRRAAILIAQRNKIRPTIVNNRKTGDVQGRFIEIAEGLDRLLPRFLRAGSRAALAKRLQRAGRS